MLGWASEKQSRPVPSVGTWLWRDLTTSAASSLLPTSSPIPVPWAAGGRLPAALSCPCPHPPLLSLWARRWGQRPGPGHGSLGSASPCSLHHRCSPPRLFLGGLGTCPGSSSPRRSPHRPVRPRPTGPAAGGPLPRAPAEGCAAGPRPPPAGPGAAPRPGPEHAQCRPDLLSLPAPAVRGAALRHGTARSGAERLGTARLGPTDCGSAALRPPRARHGAARGALRGAAAAGAAAGRPPRR